MWSVRQRWHRWCLRVLLRNFLVTVRGWQCSHFQAVHSSFSTPETQKSESSSAFLWHNPSMCDLMPLWLVFLPTKIDQRRLLWTVAICKTWLSPQLRTVRPTMCCLICLLSSFYQFQSSRTHTTLSALRLSASFRKAKSSWRKRSRFYPRCLDLWLSERSCFALQVGE